MNYLIVLFKNKERKKIIKSFKTYDNAKKFYDDKIISNKDIRFNTLFENGKSCSFEIGLLEKNSTNFDSYFIRDELGRQIKVELDNNDYTILSVSNFLIEELLYDIQTSSKISTLVSFQTLYRFHILPIFKTQAYGNLCKALFFLKQANK
jgi:hypothetical protein